MGACESKTGNWYGGVVTKRQRSKALHRVEKIQGELYNLRCQIDFIFGLSVSQIGGQ